MNLWLLQKFIDHEFEEREFLRGAKQALCVISDLINRGSWEEMEGIMSEKLASDIQRNTDLIEKLGPVVTWQQINYIRKHPESASWFCGERERQIS